MTGIFHAAGHVLNVVVTSANVADHEVESFEVQRMAKRAVNNGRAFEEALCDLGANATNAQNAGRMVALMSLAGEDPRELIQKAAQQQLKKLGLL